MGIKKKLVFLPMMKPEMKPTMNQRMNPTKLTFMFNDSHIAYRFAK